MSNLLYYDYNSKLNQKPLEGYCAVCLEKSIFRATYTKEQDNFYNKSIRLTCVRCLASFKYKKKAITKQDFYGAVALKTLTIEDKIQRLSNRIHKFLFTGTWNRKRYDFRLLRGK